MWRRVSLQEPRWRWASRRTAGTSNHDDIDVWQVGGEAEGPCYLPTILTGETGSIGQERGKDTNTEKRENKKKMGHGKGNPS